jgi:uncharacterized membrane protein
MADDLDARRLEILEGAVRRLLAEVGDLQGELRALRSIVAQESAPVREPVRPRPVEEPPATVSEPMEAAASPEPTPPLWQRVLDPPNKASAQPRRPPPPPRRAPRRTLMPAGLSFEDLVGRYGAMALAALAIMSAVGIFLSWAIAQNLIGPGVRVGAGFAAAAALGALGWRFRTRGARTFGNTLMGIALAVVHVVAWGAGPGLGVFPSWLALGVAAAASIALAVLAWRTKEESLFVVGVGGALIAPFVTTPGRGNGEALLVFGWLVLTTALYGMRDRDWPWARRLLGTAGIIYASAAMTAAWSSTGVLGKELPAVFALACAAAALLLGGLMHGPALTRAYLVAGIAPLFYDADTEGIFMPHLVTAAAGTVILLAATWRREEDGMSWLVGVFVISLGFLAAALAPLDDVTSTAGTLVALGWSVGIAAVGAMLTGRRREALWTVAALTSGLAIVLTTWEHELRTALGLSAHAAAVSMIMRRERAGLMLMPALVGLCFATFAAGLMYSERPPYTYTPFLTTVALAGLVVVLGWGALGWNIAHTELERPLGAGERRVVAFLGIVAAFLWGHAELAEAYSPDMSTFLLIFYYAACGLAAIFVGRRDSLSGLRRVGLALAIFAALKAVSQAYGLEQVGLRVGSFLLVGGFLLAVAYWYRAAGEASAADSGAS